MGGDRGSGVPDLIVYLDRSDIHEGRLEELKAGIRRLVEVIEAREPQLFAYGFHLDEEASRMYVSAVHPDSASLELHLQVGMTEFRKLSGLITLRQIEVFGSPSPRVMEMLREKAAMLGGHGVTVVRTHAGFAHTPVRG